MRKRTQNALAAFAALALIGSMAACSSEKKEEGNTSASSSQSELPSDSSSTSETEDQSPDEESTSHPETIVLEDAFGTSEFMYKADRPVGVRNGVDELFAMGITPVAFIGVESEIKQPWRAEFIKETEVIPYDESFVEKIVALHPNLIIGDQWEVNKQFYDMLSPYAPVIGPKNEEIGEGNDWRYRLQALGKIYGKEDLAEQLIADYEQMIEDTKAELPNLQGKTVLSADIDPGQGAIRIVVDPDDPSYWLFHDLGMDLPQKVKEDLSSKAQWGRAYVSFEELQYLDADYILLGAFVNSVEEGKQLIQSIPGLVDLPAFQAGHVQLDEAGANNEAVSMPTVLNRKWLLDYVKPYLEKIGK